MNSYTQHSRENNREFAYRVLHSEILSLSLTPGQMVSEHALSKQLGISRTPLREAIAELKNQHLMITVPQQATYVSPLDSQLVREGFLLRYLVEPKIYRQVQSTLDSHWTAQFEENLAAQCHAVTADDRAAFHFLDNRFHQLVYQAARKEALWHCSSTVIGHYDRVRYLLLQQGKVPMNRLLEEHQRLFVGLLTGTTGESALVDGLYQAHFGGYQRLVPLLQQELPEYFSLASTKEGDHAE